MSEAATGAVKSAVGGFISPSLAFLKSWQGVVELILRGVAMVLALILIIAGSACQGEIGGVVIDNSNIETTTRAACGWLIFVGVIALLYEVVPILLRFLNVGIVNSNITIVLIVDAIVHGGFAVAIFAGAVACAAYADDWKSFEASPFENTVRAIIRATGAAAAFGFFTLIADIAVAAFVLLGVFLFKWNPTLAKYSVSSGGAGGAD